MCCMPYINPKWLPSSNRTICFAYVSHRAHLINDLGHLTTTRQYWTFLFYVLYINLITIVFPYLGVTVPFSTPLFSMIA